jgi:hypothetical protein
VTLRCVISEYHKTTVNSGWQSWSSFTFLLCSDHPHIKRHDDCRVRKPYAYFVAFDLIGLSPYHSRWNSGWRLACADTAVN